MVVSKKELKRARKEKKTNLNAGRKTYRLKRQEAKRELKKVSGRRAVLLSHFPKLKRVAATPHQISYQEAIQKAKSEWSDHQRVTQDQFEDVLSAANPYDLTSKELREHRLPQAKRRHKQARRHLKMMTEQRKQDVRKQSAHAETHSKVGKFFYQKDKSLDQLQAEKEVFQAREEYQTLKRAKAIYTYLKAKGATNQAIAAILGNWSVESGINPKRAEGDYLSPPVGATETSWDDPAWLSLGGPAIYNGGYPNIIHRGLGLGQWTDTADGSRRHTLLLEYAKAKGKPWYDLELQLDFMLHGDNPYYTNWLKGFFGQTGSPASLAQAFLIYWEGNSGDKLIERQTRATEWHYQIEKGFSQPNGGTAQSDPAALEAVKGDLYENSIPGGGDGMGYAFGQCTWDVAARINQLGLKLKGRNGEKISITSVMGNGQDWVRSAAALGGETGSTPRAGAIISFAGGSHGTLAEYGHVSFVEKVYPDGSFLISETNVNGNPNYTFRKISGPDAAMSFAYTVK
ncbi:CHAP protein [Streptococcus pyogenes]|nr:CHAP protein [Streptococcus pyogenes]VHC80556.1 CHAP protein [Streptococcus pyogenes]